MCTHAMTDTGVTDNFNVPMTEVMCNEGNVFICEINCADYVLLPFRLGQNKITEGVELRRYGLGQRAGSATDLNTVKDVLVGGSRERVLR